MKRYLFVGAHPDDIEISAMGFLLNRLENGDECYALVLTAKTEERFNEQHKVFDYIASKYNTSDKTLFHFKLFIENFVFKDGELHKSKLEILHYVEEFIEQNKIDVVVTHFPKDTHRDHRAVSSAVTDAARKVSLLYFESPNVFNFVPNFFVALTKDELEEKYKIMSFHHSQNIKNNNFYLDKIKATAIFRGLSIYEYASEGFVAVRYHFN